MIFVNKTMLLDFNYYKSIHWQANRTVTQCIINQGHSVRVKYDAQMHYGENRGGSKQRKLNKKNVFFAKIETV